MKTRKALWTAVASGLAATCFVLPGCNPTSSPPESKVPDEPIYLRLEDFDFVITEPPLIGQEAIDAQRTWIERDLERTLAVDPDHPDVEQIRKALADLDWAERQLHWRISRGFTRPDGTYGGPYTEQDFWRALIEDWEMLGLTEEQVRAAEAHLDSLLAAKDSILADTVAATGGLLCRAAGYFALPLPLGDPRSCVRGAPTARTIPEMLSERPEMASEPRSRLVAASQPARYSAQSSMSRRLRSNRSVRMYAASTLF